MFAVVGDLAGENGVEGGAGEVELRRVLTWPSVEVLRRQLLSGLPMVSKEIRLADYGAPVYVGMCLPVGSADSWVVTAGMDRAVAPLVDGAHLTFLESDTESGGGAMAWRLWPRASARARVVATKAGLALVVND